MNGIRRKATANKERKIEMANEKQQQQHQYEEADKYNGKQKK